MNINYSSPDDWLDSKFSVSELNRKTVAFAFRGEDGHIYAGEGRLIAVAKGSLMRVRILTEHGISKDGAHVFAKAFSIPWSDAAKLVRNPSGSKCEFAIKAL